MDLIILSRVHKLQRPEVPVLDPLVSQVAVLPFRLSLSHTACLRIACPTLPVSVLPVPHCLSYCLSHTACLSIACTTLPVSVLPLSYLAVSRFSHGTVGYQN